MKATRALSDTGLPSNPTSFDKALRAGGAYDEAIRTKLREGQR